MVFDSALDIIGNTPLVRLDKIVKKYNLEGEIYAKVEYYSPGLSKKDRVAKYIIEKAIKEGTLKKDQTVIEQTSGNTGIGCALVCSILGYPFVAVMSKGNSIERVKMIEAFGGKVELVDKVSDSKGVSSLDMEAVEKRFKNLKEELGDVLLQVVMNAQVAKERGAFDFNQVVQGIVDKLIRRHPHVFGDVPRPTTPEESLKLWKSVKEKEKAIKDNKR